MHKINRKFLAISIIVLVFLGLLSFPHLKLLLEKYKLNPPPPYKRLSTEVLPSSESGKIKYPQDYTIILLGDSMTEKLGNADELRGYLNQYYPEKTFEVLNYGYGSTNILSIMDRLTTHTFYARDYRPINEISYDLLILESMGYNPLSHLPLEEGLQKQSQALEIIVNQLQKEHPTGQVVFLATIAPDKKTYAQKSIDLSKDERAKWVTERQAYIENHIKYAQDHHIPIIDLYHPSMDSQQNGKYIFIDQTDFIHPSPTGVLYISKGIADFIAKNKLLHE